MSAVLLGALVHKHLFEHLLLSLVGAHLRVQLLGGVTFCLHTGRTPVHSHQRCVRFQLLSVLMHTCHWASFIIIVVMMVGVRCCLTVVYDLHFPNGHLFMFIAHWYVSSGNRSSQPLCPVLNCYNFC